MKNFWKNKNVFITGCTGFLGSWLSQELVERSANLVGLVRDIVPGSRLYLSGTAGRMNIVKGELEDYFLMERIMNEYEIDYVFHLAAQPIVGISNTSPISTFKSNIEGTWNVLEAARRIGKLKGMVVASSDKAYGEHKKLPYKEESPLQAYFPYDVSKSCADLLTNAYFKTYALKVCVVRCGNFYGGGDLNFNRVVPGTIRSIMEGKRPIIRSDGKYLRDYIYIKDAVRAYMMLAEKMPSKKIYGEAFNFSYGEPVSVIRMVKLILELMGKKGTKPIILSEAKNEIRKQYLSSSKARKLLNWEPAYSLKAGLQETIEWYSEKEL